MRRRAPILVAVLLIVVPMARAAPPLTRAEERQRLNAIVRPFVDQQWLRGAVVGVIDPTGRRVYAYGRTALDPRSPAPDGDTVYEIASVTKTFTALLLADMAQRKEVSLDEPVANLLPPAVNLPDAKPPITLLSLATHHSGLPRMPGNFRPADAANPYADYTVDRLYDFLPTARLHDPARFEYSNVGYGLLGHALALRAKLSYESLVVARIAAPLGMNDTRVALRDDQRPRLAQPFDADLLPEQNWDFAALGGAGALRSTANDLLKYLAAQLDLAPEADRLPPPLRRAIAATHAPRAAADAPDIKVALGWHLTPADGRLFHNGQTGGYHSFVAIDPRARAGVVVLTNTATMRADDIGGRAMRLVTGQVVPPVDLPAALKPDLKLLDRYAGRYTLPNGKTLLVLRDGDRLITSAPGQPAVRIYPKSATDFFAKATDSTGTFAVDAESGKVTTLRIVQDGRDLVAKRAD
jgi:CubicO group peptidase (beta-lactamase class C family)